MAYGTIAANKSQRVSMVSGVLKVGGVDEFCMPVIEKSRHHDDAVTGNAASLARLWSHFRHYSSYSPKADAFVVPIFKGTRPSYRLNKTRVNDLKVSPGFTDVKQPPIVVMLNQRSLLSRDFEGDTATAKVAELESEGML